MAGHRVTSAAVAVMRLLDLYERIAAADEAALARYLELCDPDVEITATVAGTSVRTRGQAELRRLFEQAAAGDTHHRLLNRKIIEDAETATVIESTLLVLRGEVPLLAVPVDYRVELREGLLLRMASTERCTGRPPDWAPLGSTVSTAGEILARWGDEGILVRLRDGRPVELRAPEHERLSFEVGDPVLVFFERGQAVGWYLPDLQVGVDLRGGPS